MKNGFRQSMAWLHTWVGLGLGWVVFAIFVMGTVSYFKDEVSQWMQPETQFAVPAPMQSAATALAAMQRIAPDARLWGMSLPNARTPVLNVYWQEPAGRYQQAMLNPLTGDPIVARASQGGDFFYRFHYQLYGLPSTWGSLIVGAAAMFMLLALISGVITHKKIFKDFFTFRHHKGQRSWLDFHNLAGVVALPFFVMISYTGLAIFFYLYMPFGLMARYGSEAGKFYDEIQKGTAAVTAAPRALPMSDWSPLIALASTRWQDGAPIGSIEVRQPNTNQAIVTFTRQAGAMLNARFGATQSFNAVTGARLPNQRNHEAVAQTGGVIYGLHEAHFARISLRWGLFASGLLGCAMVATGMILWTVKRRRQTLKVAKVSFGHHLVERLNLTTIVGLPLAIGGYLAANRLLPVDIAGRSDMEVRAFFIVWAGALAYACLRTWQQGWRELIGLTAALYLLIPVLSFVIKPAYALPLSLIHGQTVLAAVDLTLWGFGLFFAGVSYRLWRPRAAQRHFTKKHHGLRSEGE